MVVTASSIFLPQKWAAVYANTIGYTYKIQFPAVIAIDTFKGDIPSNADLVIAEKDNVEDTSMTLYGFDEIYDFIDLFKNPIYGFYYFN